MSDFETSDVSCPSCGAPMTISTANSINAWRHPWAREQVRSGAFHRFGCDACSETFHVERDFVYHDSDARQFFVVYEPTSATAWQEQERLTERLCVETFQSGPSGVEQLGLTYEIRTVFGRRALIDKLLIADAGLDDALVELVKLELVTSVPALGARPLLEVMVTAVSATDDVIELVAYDREGEPNPIEFSADLRRYRDFENQRSTLVERWPNLFHRTYRSYHRLAVEPARTLRETP